MKELNAIQRKQASNGQEQENQGRDVGVGFVDFSKNDGCVIDVDTAIAMEEEQTRQAKMTKPESEEKNNDGQGRENNAGSSFDNIRVKDLTLLWILFQCFWPAVLNIFCDYITVPKLLAPYALTFWLVAYAIKGDILNEFRLRYLTPSALWVAAYILGESDLWDGAQVFLLLLLVLAFLMSIVLGPKKAWELGPRRMCQGLAIKLSGKADAFERWLTKTFLPDSFPRGDDDEDGKERTKDDINIQNLEYLESLSKRGELKRPTWVLAALGVLIVWQVVFLFVVHSTVLSAFSGRTLTTNIVEMVTDRERLRTTPNIREQILHGLKEEFEEHAVELTDETFDHFMDNHKAVFIHLYAPWAVWCQRLHPTWERFAKEAHVLHGETLGVGKVNCAVYYELCKDQKVMAFPTLRWYESGKAVLPDYKMERTLDALMGYAKQKLLDWGGPSLAPPPPLKSSLLQKS